MPSPKKGQYKRSAEQRAEMSRKMKERHAARRQAEGQAALAVPEPVVPILPPVQASPVPKVEDNHEEFPPNLFDGQRKNFEIMGQNGSFTDPIPGFYLYWFIDRGDGRLQMAKRSGYEFVDYDEVVMNEDIVTGNDDLGGHVRKFAKEVLDGKPVYQYLMKKPLWLKAKHDEQLEMVHIKQEEAIMAGRVSKKKEDAQYARGDIPGSQLPKITIGQTLARPR